MVAKAARRYLLIAGLICLVSLIGISIAMMQYLEEFETPRFRLPELTKLHLVWYAIGCIMFSLSFILAIIRPILFAALFACLVIGTLSGAFIQGETHQNLPYVHFGGLHINAAEASAIGLLAPLACLIAYFRKRSWTMLLLISGLFILFVSIGSDNATACLGLAIGSMALFDYFSSSQLNALALSLLSLAVFCSSILKCIFLTIHNESKVLLTNPFVLYDIKADANGHTEFIFSHIVEHFGIIIACSCIFLILILTTRLVLLSFTTKNRQAHFSSIGVTAFFVGQILFNLLVAKGLIINPSSGVSLPFVSYGGSQLIMQLALIGGTLALIFRNQKFEIQH